MLSIIKNGLKILLFSGLFITIPLMATGPRISSNFISTDKNELYSLDLPPFISTEIDGGGMLNEIVTAAFAQENIDIVIVTVPLQSMIKYYLVQEESLGVMGHNLGINSKEKESLISIPLYISNENYMYYKPMHTKGLEFSGRLSELKEFTYGASKGENIDKYREAGVTVKKGRMLSLFKKLKNGRVDFISIPKESAEWFLEKNYSEDKNNFVTMKNSNSLVPISIYFNIKHNNGKKFAEALKKGLMRILENGKYSSILRKHLKDSNTIDFQSKEIKKYLK